jgi:uncharacterized caspase-like protein
LRIPTLLLLLTGLTTVVGCTSKQENAADTRGITVAQKVVPPKRIALVIGNARYTSSPLSNPVNDAELIYRTLQGLGFTTRLYTDRSQREMKTAIKEFGAALQAAAPNAIGVFYYAGHGVQVNGRNYLIPVGARISSDADVDIEAVSADSVLDQMRESRNRLNFLILDACRNNPFPRSSRSAAGGLAQMDAPAGVLIAYSTAPGDVAADGSGRNSPYSQALARAMRSSGEPAELMFKEARDEVMRVTSERQTPWEASSLTGQNFYFSSAAEQGRVANAPLAPGPETAASPAVPVAERKTSTLRVAATERPTTARAPATSTSSSSNASSDANTGTKAAQAGRKVGGLVVGFGKGIFDASKQIVRPGSKPNPAEDGGQQRR